MSKLVLTKNFKHVEKDWTRLYEITPKVSPFLHPVAMKIAVRYFYPYYIVWRCRPIFATYEVYGKTQVIVPLLKFKGGKYKLFGNVNGFNECGCVYADEKNLEECFDVLPDEIGSIEMARIDERSHLSSFVPEEAKQTVNVAIDFGDDYDAYFKLLSSSVRQNVRTAYNRLETDGHTLSVQIFNNAIEKKGGGNFLPISDMVNLYSQRHNERYGVRTSRFKKWFLKHQNFATRFYRFSPNALTVYLTIDGTPAAFLSGLYTDERLIVPRLSINNEFRRYSPGMILVCETIKYLIGNTSIRTLDLSQGEEEYKYKLGGKQHISYRFNLES